MDLPSEKETIANSFGGRIPKKYDHVAIERELEKYPPNIWYIIIQNIFVGPIFISYMFFSGQLRSNLDISLMWIGFLLWFSFFTNIVYLTWRKINVRYLVILLVMNFLVLLLPIYVVIINSYWILIIGFIFLAFLPFVIILNKAQEDCESGWLLSLTITDILLKLNNTNFKQWKKRGYYLDMLGSYKEALESYDKALEFDSTDDSILCNRGNCLQKVMHYSEAIQSYDKALAINPESIIVHFNKGLTLMRLNKYRDAIKGFERVIKINPEYDSAWMFLGDCLSLVGQHEKAIESHNKALELDPENIDFYLQRAFSYAIKGDIKNTLLDINEAINRGFDIIDKAKFISKFSSIKNNEDFKNFVEKYFVVVE